MTQVKLFIIDEAREEFEKLNKVVGEQKDRIRYDIILAKNTPF